MLSKKLTKKVLKAMRHHDLVRFDRFVDGDGWLEGYVVAVGECWVVVALVTQGEPDGWAVFARSDLRSFWASPGDRFMRRVLELDGQWPPAGPTESLPLTGPSGSWSNPLRPRSPWWPSGPKPKTTLASTTSAVLSAGPPRSCTGRT